MKYAGLLDFLKAQSADVLQMTFAEVAEAAQVRLPASAYKHPQWWQNDPIHHVQARAWNGAGFVTEQVDIAGQTVVFRRTRKESGGVRETPDAFEYWPAQEHHPMFRALKGASAIEPGWDLTRPALNEDELAAWEADVDRTADAIEKHRRT